MKVENEGDQRIGKRTGKLVKKKTSRYYPDYRIIKIVQNTEKSPACLRRLAVIQTTALLRSTRILRRVLDVLEDLLSFGLQHY